MASALGGEKRKSRSESSSQAIDAAVLLYIAATCSILRSQLRRWGTHCVYIWQVVKQLGYVYCRLEPAQLRVAQSASSMVPPLPLTIGTLKEKQAYERELRTVTVGMCCFLNPCREFKPSCSS